MKGKYHVIVQNRYLKYEFDIKRNITLIQGDSATGKTTLVDMIREYHLDRKSGINLSCECPCRVLEGDLWREQIEFIHDSILFIDEGAAFVETKAFAEAIANSSNYFVIVTRENLEMLPVSVEEVYGIKSSGKYGTLEPVYHEMYHIYDVAFRTEQTLPVYPQKILMEDSHSGYEFFSDVAEKNGLCCDTAEGKSNIYNYLIENEIKDDLLIIADGAAFASQMNRLKHLLVRNRYLHLYLPESFEWLVLKADLLKDNEVREILENPEDFIDSSEFLSWERFFYKLLSDKTKGTYLQYSKSKLNENYLQENFQERILLCIDGIDFKRRDD